MSVRFAGLLVHKQNDEANLILFSTRGFASASGVFPRGFQKDNPLDLKIRQLNAILKSRLQDKPGVTFLDIGDKLRQPDGSISKEIFSDGTHPTDAGYAIWGKALKEAGAIPSD